MEAVKLTCPCCAGNIDIDFEEIIKCKYCGVSLINPLKKDTKLKKKDLFKIELDNIKEIEAEIDRIKKKIDVEENGTYRPGQEHINYGYPIRFGCFLSSSNTRVVSKIYISDEMLETDEGLYMFSDKEKEYIRYYIFCAKTLSEYTRLFTEQYNNGNQDEKSKELIAQMDALMSNFIKEKKKMEEKDNKTMKLVLK